MTDPTDRQRAEAKAWDIMQGADPSFTQANIADALLSFRREGYEAGREEAATVLRQEGYSAAASRIRALKPKE